MFRKVAAAVVVLTMTMQAKATDPVQLYAAGSLRAALTEIAAAFEAQASIKVQAKFGPSGTLKDEIARGARADVFASANMEHPQAFARREKERAGYPLCAQPALRPGETRSGS
jgi:ABC-type molybdate transport system substrate-binding protein